MSNGAQAYVNTAQLTSSPRETEAQALLMAAKRLQEAITNWEKGDKNINAALLFNRKLWTIFLTSATSGDNPQSVEIRQNIANIGMFVMMRTMELQLTPDPEKLKPLIEINCNLAAGLSGRG